MNCPFCITNSVVTPLSRTTILVFEISFLILCALLFFYIFKINHKKTIKNLIITTIGVILFELMIEPMVLNTGFSNWTYFYRDLSFIVTLSWILIVSVSISLVDFAFPKLSSFKRFWLYLCTVDALALPLEIFLVQKGMRVYSESLIASSYGAYIPFTIVPFEVALAIPLYFALVIGFTKYWENIK